MKVRLLTLTPESLRRDLRMFSNERAVGLANITFLRNHRGPQERDALALANRIERVLTGIQEIVDHLLDALPTGQDRTETPVGLLARHKKRHLEIMRETLAVNAALHEWHRSAFPEEHR